MGALESRICDFLCGRDVDPVGFAGPERLDGPPSLNPRRTMRGALSIVSKASAELWRRLYFGFEPGSVIRGSLYRREFERTARSRFGRDPAGHQTVATSEPES